MYLHFTAYIMAARGLSSNPPSLPATKNLENLAENRVKTIL